MNLYYMIRMNPIKGLRKYQLGRLMFILRNYGESFKIRGNLNLSGSSIVISYVFSTLQNAPGFRPSISFTTWVLEETF